VIPPLPSAPVPVVEVDKPLTNVAKVCHIVEGFSSNQLLDLHVWLSERPPAEIDAVRLATAGFNALTEAELPLYFDYLKQHLTPQLWALLTE